MRTEFLCVSVLRVASGPRSKLASCKSALNPRAVVPVLVLLFGALWFILRGDLLYVLPCAILFLCFSVLIALRLPRMGKRELILLLFLCLIDLCLFGFVGFFFPLMSGKGCVCVALPGLFSYPFSSSLEGPTSNTVRFAQNSFQFQAAKLWNSFPEEARKITGFGNLYVLYLEMEWSTVQVCPLAAMFLPASFAFWLLPVLTCLYLMFALLSCCFVIFLNVCVFVFCFVFNSSISLHVFLHALNLCSFIHAPLY